MQEWLETLKETMEDDFAITEIIEMLDDRCEDVDDAIYALENSDIGQMLNLYFTRDTLEIYNDNWHTINNHIDSAILSGCTFDQWNPIHHIAVIEYYRFQASQILCELEETKNGER